MTKGHFPHLINAPAQYDLVLDKPPPFQYYDMPEERREEFEAWRESFQGPYVFKDQLAEYNLLDTVLLYRIALRFMKNSFQMEGRMSAELPHAEDFQESKQAHTVYKPEWLRSWVNSHAVRVGYMMFNRRKENEREGLPPWNLNNPLHLKFVGCISALDCINRAKRIFSADSLKVAVKPTVIW